MGIRSVGNIKLVRVQKKDLASLTAEKTSKKIVFDMAQETFDFKTDDINRFHQRYMNNKSLSRKIRGTIKDSGGYVDLKEFGLGTSKVTNLDSRMAELMDLIASSKLKQYDMMNNYVAPDKYHNQRLKLGNCLIDLVNDPKRKTNEVILSNQANQNLVKIKVERNNVTYQIFQPKQLVNDNLRLTELLAYGLSQNWDILEGMFRLYEKQLP